MRLKRYPGERRYGGKTVESTDCAVPSAGPPAKVFALSNHEPDSDANVLARGILGDVKGEPVVISPLYKQRFRLQDGRSIDDTEKVLNVWPVKIEQGRVWVQEQPQVTEPKVAEIIAMASV